MPTAKDLVDAVRAGDLEKVQALLGIRPELVNMNMGEDEHRAIHYAVVNRSPEMTRMLMRHGADARKGIHPHRDATAALTLATERGFDDIVAIIREEEQRRIETHAGSSVGATPENLFDIDTWESGQAFEILRADPALVHSANPEGATPLHAAACVLHQEATAWLLDQGADPNCRAHGKWTPIDLAASRKGWGEKGTPAKFEEIAYLLLRRGAELTPFAAVALGNTDWIRACRAEGMLASPVSNDIFKDLGGLLSTAMAHQRREMLALLLDLGFDPNERMRLEGTDEIIHTEGGPLYTCVRMGDRPMAEMLLAKGANPNDNVYASGPALYRAYFQDDRELVQLFERHGGVLDAVSAGFLRRTEVARQILSNQTAGSRVAEELLWSGAGGGDSEIVRMALARIDWPRDDARWLWPLWQAFTCDIGIARGLACFRVLLDHADANANDSGRTILHTVMARGEEEHVPYAEMLLDAGARIDIRDDLLRSTALGWACRWGRVHFVKLLMRRGADPVEKDAEVWATPMAWAEKMKHDTARVVLAEHSRH